MAFTSLSPQSLKYLLRPFTEKFCQPLIESEMIVFNNILYKYLKEIVILYDKMVCLSVIMDHFFHKYPWAVDIM